MATSADGQSLYTRKLAVPSWIFEADVSMRPVRIESSALAALQVLVDSKSLRFCENTSDAVELITQVRFLYMYGS
jgi:hypothetical protein